MRALPLRVWNARRMVVMASVSSWRTCSAARASPALASTSAASSRKISRISGSSSRPLDTASAAGMGTGSAARLAGASAGSARSACAGLGLQIQGRQPQIGRVQRRQLQAALRKHVGLRAAAVSRQIQRQHRQGLVAQRRWDGAFARTCTRARCCSLARCRTGARRGQATALAGAGLLHDAVKFQRHRQGVGVGLVSVGRAGQRLQVGKAAGAVFAGHHRRQVAGGRIEAEQATSPSAAAR